jgi:2-methylcitrate dehydratase PrpD
MQPHVEGSPLLALQVAFAARSALVAVDLAATGIEGPKNIITGTFGYLPLFEGAYDIGETWKSWGKDWRLLEVGHKPYPCGRLAHFGIEALQEMMAAHHFAADDVKAVLCRVPPLPLRLVGRPDVPAPNPNYAKLCLAYLGAATLLRGTVVPEDFAAQALTDPATHAVAAKFVFEDDGNPDPNTFGPQTIVVTLNSGARYERKITYALGDPRNPLSRAQQLEKFWWAWKAGAGSIPRSKGEKLIALIDRLEELPDVSALIDCVIP